MADFKRVMFSDESHFGLRFLKPGDPIKEAQRLGPLCPGVHQKTVKNPQKGMVWGCFSWRERRGLEFLKKEEMMHGVRYRQLLDRPPATGQRFCWLIPVEVPHPVGEVSRQFP